MSRNEIAEALMRAEQDAETIQDIINYVFLQYSASKLSDIEYQQIMILLAKERDGCKDLVEELTNDLQAMKTLRK